MLGGTGERPARLAAPSRLLHRPGRPTRQQKGFPREERTQFARVSSGIALRISRAVNDQFAAADSRPPTHLGWSLAVRVVICRPRARRKSRRGHYPGVEGSRTSTPSRGDHGPYGTSAGTKTPPGDRSGISRRGRHQHRKGVKTDAISLCQ
jgi:hypothetical protein